MITVALYRVIYFQFFYIHLPLYSLNFYFLFCPYLLFDVLNIFLFFSLSLYYFYFFIDTESCFGPDIFILNLGCGIVMTLQKQKNKYGENIHPENDDIENDDDDENNSNDNNNDSENSTKSSNNDYNSTTTNTTTVDNNILHNKNTIKNNSNMNTSINTPIQTIQTKKSKLKKYLYLPSCSLLVLRGDARYLWSHGIAPRTTDKVLYERGSGEKRGEERRGERRREEKEKRRKGEGGKLKKYQSMIK